MRSDTPTEEKVKERKISIVERCFKRERERERDGERGTDTYKER